MRTGEADALNAHHRPPHQMLGGVRTPGFRVAGIAEWEVAADGRLISQHGSKPVGIVTTDDIGPWPSRWAGATAPEVPVVASMGTIC